MARLKQDYIKRIALINDVLFDAEIEAQRLKGVVNKFRYYFAADPNEEGLRNLYGALANFNAAREKEEKLRKQLENEIKDYSLFYEEEK